MANNRVNKGRSDAELVETCNQGSAKAAENAFETLFKRHREYVLRVAFRFVHDREVATDVLQDTFLYLLRRFPPTGSGLQLTARLTTFLYPVVKNFAITAARKAERSASTGEIAPDELPAPEDHAAGDEVDEALAGLTDDRREVLVLRFVDDMSLKDIAKALDIPLGTVKSRIHLAIGDLRADPSVKKLFDP